MPMGKEWYHLNGGRGKSSSSSSSNSSNSKRPRRGGGGGEKETSSTLLSSSTSSSAAGCISAVFQLFDFHQFHFPLHNQPSFKFPPPPSHSFPEEPSTVLKGSGIEAPRNSLELDQSPLPLSPSARVITRRDQHIPLHSSSDVVLSRKDEHLLTPAMGIGQIKTSRDKNSNLASSPEIASSPGTKTPTLVARLMGLDLLPDSASSSPRPSSTLNTPSSVCRQPFHASQTSHHRYSSGSGRKSCSDVDYSSSRTSLSLPDTPRMSLARRSDVDHHHRLSLQINKENTGSTVVEEFDFSRFKKELKSSSEDGAARSPSHYARQIVKQVKESVSRRVGMIDITNTIRSRSSEQPTSMLDQIPKQKKPPRISRVPALVEDWSMSCPPRLRVPEDNNTTQNPQFPGSLRGSTQPMTLDPMRTTNTKPQRYDSTAHQKSSCGNMSGSGNDKRVGRPTSTSTRCRLASATVGMRSKQLGEQTVRARKGATTTMMGSTYNHRNDNNNIVTDKKGRTTSSLGGIRKFVVGGPNAAAAVLPVKKDPSPPATKIPQKQAVHDVQMVSQLSACTSHKYCHANVARAKDMSKPNGATSIGIIITTTVIDRQAELQYASEILRSVGVERDTQLSSFIGWLSPSHPIDPSTFDGLETIFPMRSADDPDDVGCTWRQSSDRLSDRKLIFELVDELLADFLKPYWNLKPWTNGIQFYGSSSVCRTGSELIDKLQAKIERFPRANCHVLADIDMIIDKDLPRSEVRSQTAFEEAGDSLVFELERAIWEDLVREVVTEGFGFDRPSSVRTVHGNGAVYGFDFGGQGLRRRAQKVT